MSNRPVGGTMRSPSTPSAPFVASTRRRMSACREEQAEHERKADLRMVRSHSAGALVEGAHRWTDDALGVPDRHQPGSSRGMLMRDARVRVMLDLVYVARHVAKRS